VKLIQKQLKILEDQKFIAKRYDKSYKLRGKPAAYYILPSGARQLETSPDEPINYKRIYKEKNVSDAFISHCSHVVDLYLGLKTQLPEDDTFAYATKSELSYDRYDYFPYPLPDVYIRLKKIKNEPKFFLDIFDEKQPYFVLVRRIKRYLAYSESRAWDDTNTLFPIVLIACSSTSDQKRLHKRIFKELQDSYEEITFATTTVAEITDQSEDMEIWRPIQSNGDKFEEAVDLRAFQIEFSAEE
jgi:hypothetical protein